MMKLRSTTPTSRKLKTRVGLLVVAAVMALAVPLAFSQQANADQYDARIAQLQQQIDQYQASARVLGEQADSLQRTVDSLTNEIAQMQAQIDLNQAKYDKLILEIKETEKQIADNRDALGEVIADLSIESDISPLEMIMSSKNISDYIDKQTYQSSIKDELNSTIERIKELKAQLENQKVQTEELLASQTRDREALAAKRAEQQRLVNETRGQEAAYQQLKGKTEAEKQSVMNAQQAAIQAASARSGGVSFVGGGDGGYPWGSGNCPMSGMYSTGGANGNGGDGWGYGCRQCVSYAAWKVGERTGVIPTNAGNANNLPASLSYRPQGSSAKANSLGIISAGAYGHVVWVETDPDASGYITVSQYNANYGGGWGNFTRIRTHQSTYDRYIYYN